MSKVLPPFPRPMLCSGDGSSCSLGGRECVGNLDLRLERRTLETPPPTKLVALEPMGCVARRRYVLRSGAMFGCRRQRSSLDVPRRASNMWKGLCAVVSSLRRVWTPVLSPPLVHPPRRSAALSPATASRLYAISLRWPSGGCASGGGGGGGGRGGPAVLVRCKWPPGALRGLRGRSSVACTSVHRMWRAATREASVAVKLVLPCLRCADRRLVPKYSA